MYSVIRFNFDRCSSEHQTLLLKAIETEEACGPVQYDYGADKRVSLEVSDASNPGDHMASVVSYIRTKRGLLKTLSSKGVEVSIDIGIEPEDFEDRKIFELLIDQSQLAALTANGIDLNLSVYSPMRELDGDE